MNSSPWAPGWGRGSLSPSFLLFPAAGGHLALKGPLTVLCLCEGPRFPLPSILLSMTLKEVCEEGRNQGCKGPRSLADQLGIWVVGHSGPTLRYERRLGYGCRTALGLHLQPQVQTEKSESQLVSFLLNGACARSTRRPDLPFRELSNTPSLGRDGTLVEMGRGA